MVLKLLFACCIALATSAPLLALSHSEVFAGFVIPTGVSSNNNSRADELDIGGFGTMISIDGQFPLFGRFYFSPTASFLAAASTTSAVELSANNQLDFRQGDLAVDLLWQIPKSERVRAGAGAAYGWWNAVTKQKIDSYGRTDLSARRFARGQAWMARASAHWFLRDPKRAGVSLHGTIALPITDIMDETAWAASGYVGVGAGFSMPLK